MAFLALASFARRAPIVIPGQFRQFSSVITAGIWNRAPTWAPPPGNHLPALAEQLIDLRRRFSASSAWNFRHSATPVEVGLTPPSSASAERTTGVASIPSGDIELSTGLDDPQSFPSGEGKRGRGTVETPTAERTIDPTGGQSPVGDRLADSDVPPAAEPSASSTTSNTPPADTGDSSTSSGLTGGPSPDPDGKSSKEDEPVRIVQANQQTIVDDLLDLLRYQQSRMWLKSLVVACDPNFKESEFLESAKDAYWIVLNLFATKCLDLELLAHMLSKPMLSAIKGAHEEAKAKGLASRLLQHDIDSAAIVNLQILDREMMAELDPDLAAQGPKSDASESQSFQASLNPYTASWMVISVKFTGLLKTELYNISDGKAQSVIEDRRSHIWRFARGPLPDKLPELNIDAPWVVLDVVD